MKSPPFVFAHLHLHLIGYSAGYVGRCWLGLMLLLLIVVDARLVEVTEPGLRRLAVSPPQFSYYSLCDLHVTTHIFTTIIVCVRDSVVLAILQIIMATVPLTSSEWYIRLLPIDPDRSSSSHVEKVFTLRQLLFSTDPLEHDEDIGVNSSTTPLLVAGGVVLGRDKTDAHKRDVGVSFGLPIFPSRPCFFLLPRTMPCHTSFSASRAPLRLTSSSSTRNALRLTDRIVR